jgi:mono/diheme cytochrome c family protein
MNRCAAIALPVLLACAVGGCEHAMHDMYQEPRYDALAPSPLFADGNSARVPPAGTRERAAGARADASAGRLGLTGAISPAWPGGRDDQASNDVVADGAAAPTPVLLARGRDRFDIYCAPCHGRSGDGNGMIAERGFPHPPTFHSPRLRQAPDAHFAAVIRDGHGAMASYAAQVDQRDRRAIVAWIRVLQLAAHAPARVLDDGDRSALQHAAATPAAGGDR